MEIGLCFPYTQPSLSRESVLEWFRRVDEGPFSSLSCGERMVGPCVEMGATLAAAAAVTVAVVAEEGGGEGREYPTGTDRVMYTNDGIPPCDRASDSTTTLKFCSPSLKSL